MNLPVQLTSFIGREADLAAIEALLSTARLVTLTGAGGSGKTRLAIQIATTVSEVFSDGAWLVDLTSLREPELVPQVVAQAVGLQPVVDQPLLESLLYFFRSKQLLLVLDNCEHLTAACAQIAGQLLSEAPELRILATSREPLSIAGERIYPLSGLAWPAPGKEKAQDERKGLDLQEIMGYDAVSLFVERARAVSPQFTLTSGNALAIAEVCRRLEGLPLALELASARVSVLTVQEIAARLNDSLALLTTGKSIGLEPRHLTLRTAIDWSYSLLTTEEQTLLGRIAVFAGGFTIDTVEAVCAGGEIFPGQILDLLSTMVAKSLLIADTTGRSQARYHLLETIREYALEKLDQADQTVGLFDRHLDVFLSRAEEAAPKLEDANQQLWLNWLEDEHDNLRTALAWALESDRIEAGLRIAIAITRFWEIRGYVQEGMAWFKRLLVRADDRISPLVHANALTFASFLAMFLGNVPAATSYGREAVDLAEAAGDEGNPILILALSSLIAAARLSGDYRTAFSIGEQVIQMLRTSPGPSFYLGMSLLAHGDVAIEAGHYVTAQAVLEESLLMARKAGDAYRIAHTFNSLGDLSRYQDNYTEAALAYEKSIALLRELGAEHDLASMLRNLGRTCLLLGDAARACTLFRESMSIHQAEQSLSGIAECLVGFAAAALKSGLPAAGARLLAAAPAIGGQRWIASVWPAKRMDYDEYLALARTRLTQGEFQAEQEAGRAMTVEQAIEYAQSLVLEPYASSAIRGKLGVLTNREREVAALIAQGKSNSGIAQELVLSKRTVEKHSANILSKLELTNRSQIVRWVIEFGLIPATK